MHAATCSEPLVGHHFRANEPTLDVGVNLAGGELCSRLLRNRPRAALVVTNGEERHVAEQVVARLDDPVQAGLDEPEIREKCCRIGLLELRNLQLDLRADRDGLGRGVREKAGHPRVCSGPVEVGADPGKIALVEVDDEQEWLGRQELKAAQQLAIVARQLEGPQRPALFER